MTAEQAELNLYMILQGDSRFVCTSTLKEAEGYLDVIVEENKELKAPLFDWEFAARQFDADVLNKAIEIVKEEPSVIPVKMKRWLEIKALWDISDYLQTNYLKK